MNFSFSDPKFAEMVLFVILATAILVVNLLLTFLASKSMRGKMRYRKKLKESLRGRRFNDSIYTSDRDLNIRRQRESNMAEILRRVQIRCVLIGLMNLATATILYLFFLWIR